MTTHTDRIRQMAQEADPDFGNLDGDMPDALCGIEAITRFAQLVAEDCAQHVNRSLMELLGRRAMTRR